MPAKYADPAAPHLIPREEDEDLSDGDSINLTEQMNEMPVATRRRVYALKHYYEKTKAVRRALHEELAQQEKAKKAKLAALEAKRLDIIAGLRDITAEEVAALPALELQVLPEEEPQSKAGKKKVNTVDPKEEAELKQLQKAASAPDGGIPFFWLKCLEHHDALAGLISDRDRPVLKTLSNITTEFIEDTPLKGVKISFFFEEKPFGEANPYLDASKGPLVIGFHMELDEDSDEMVVSSMEGCEIPWRSASVNPTVVLKKRKQRNKHTKEMRVVEREEPCESFFTIFKSIQDHDEDDQDDEDEDPFGAMDMNISAGQAIIEDIVPRAAFYYSGLAVDKVVQEMFDTFGMNDWGNMNDDDDEEEEDESGEDDNAPRPNFKAMVQKNAPASAGGKKAPECKEQ